MYPNLCKDNSRNHKKEKEKEKEKQNGDKKMNEKTFSKEKIGLFRSFIKYVRFPLMDTKYFKQNVRDSGVLTKDEIHSIYEFKLMKEPSIFKSTPRKFNVDGEDISSLFFCPIM